MARHRGCCGGSVALPPPLLVVLLAAAAALATTSSAREHEQYLEVAENAPAGTKVGYIEVENPPVQLVVPVLGSAVDADLDIDLVTGEIRTRAALDREARASYSLVALPQNVRVVVRVLDVNDNAPRFPVERVDVEFSENSPREAKRALPPARDPDVGAFSTQRYEIVAGNEGGMFKLYTVRVLGVFWGRFS